MLIVLDSCEYIIEATAVFAEQLLRGALGVHVLATSREPLRAAGEVVRRLPPLEIPPLLDTLTAHQALADDLQLQPFVVAEIVVLPARAEGPCIVLLGLKRVLTPFAVAEMVRHEHKRAQPGPGQAHGLQKNWHTVGRHDAGTVDIAQTSVTRTHV